MEQVAISTCSNPHPSIIEHRKHLDEAIYIFNRYRTDYCFSSEELRLLAKAAMLFRFINDAGVANDQELLEIIKDLPNKFVELMRGEAKSIVNQVEEASFDDLMFYKDVFYQGMSSYYQQIIDQYLYVKEQELQDIKLSSSLRNNSIAQHSKNIFKSVMQGEKPDYELIRRQHAEDLKNISRYCLPQALEILGCYVKEDTTYHPEKHANSKIYNVTTDEQKCFFIKITGDAWVNTNSGKGNHGLKTLVMHLWKENEMQAQSRIEGNPVTKTGKEAELAAQPLQFYTAEYPLPPIKDDKYTMEFPFFSLKAGDMKPKIYDKNGIKIVVTPSYYGMATQDDKDLWIFAISQLVHGINQGKPITSTVRFKMADFLKATGRPISGNGYQRAVQALKRLDGTRIHTNIKTPNYQDRGSFGLLDSWRVIERNGDGKTVAVEITLSKWLMCAIEGEKPHVLTLHPDYFLLRKPLLRRLYELVRKHCGQQDEWQISLEVLHEKSGSDSILRRFKHEIKKIAQENVLPEYDMKFNEESNLVIFTKRK